MGAFGAHDIAIEGPGTLCGQGEHFWGEVDGAQPFARYQHRTPLGFRPFSLVQFRECRSIGVRDITIQDSATYALWALGCDDLSIQGVTINNNLEGPNTDGLDIDCCSNVTIEECDLTTGDDCIAIKSDTATLGRDKACEDISVARCRLTSSKNGVRVGWEGDGAIRNCSFRDLTIERSRTGLCVNVIRIGTTVINGFDYSIEAGPRISGITFEGITIEAQKAIHLWVGNEVEGELTGYMRDITFRNIKAQVTRGCNITALPENPIDGLTLENVTLELSGEAGEDFIDEVPHPLSVWGTYDTRGLPYGIFCRYVRGLELCNVTVRWGELEGPWR
ncbi:MAG: glycoside hydrolase family 28 protein, partial [Planctomycetota bacterium]